MKECIIMTIASSKHGLALELLLIEELVKTMPPDSVTLTKQTEAFMKNAQKHVKALDTDTITSIVRYAQKIVGWLERKWSICSKKIIVHRLSDQDARNGDVTDICISIEGEGDVNLSLKHNHDALKHQRPLSAAQWIGLPRKSNEDLQHRRAMANAVTCFLEKAEIACPGAILFTDVDAKDPTACALLSAEIIDEVLDTFREHDFARTLFSELLREIKDNSSHPLVGMLKSGTPSIKQKDGYDGMFWVDPSIHTVEGEDGKPEDWWKADNYQFFGQDEDNNPLVF